MCVCVVLFVSFCASCKKSTQVTDVKFVVKSATQDMHNEFSRKVGAFAQNFNFNQLNGCRLLAIQFCRQLLPVLACVWFHEHDAASVASVTQPLHCTTDAAHTDPVDSAAPHALNN